MNVYDRRRHVLLTRGLSAYGVQLYTCTAYTHFRADAVVAVCGCVSVDGAVGAGRRRALAIARDG